MKLRVTSAIESVFYHSLERDHPYVWYAFLSVALGYAYSNTSISYSGVSRAPVASLGRKLVNSIRVLIITSVDSVTTGSIRVELM